VITFFLGAESVAKRRKNCDEFLVSDPYAGENKREDGGLSFLTIYRQNVSILGLPVYKT